MAELYHYFGQDLVLAANGDLLTASDPLETNQRILRRLMTNAGAYIWDLTYGAGLPAQVGKKIVAQSITALVRNQIFKEPTVAASPPPTVSLAPQANGTVVCDITYTFAPTNQSVSLSFQLNSSGNVTALP